MIAKLAGLFEVGTAILMAFLLLTGHVALTIDGESAKGVLVLLLTCTLVLGVNNILGVTPKVRSR